MEGLKASLRAIISHDLCCFVDLFVGSDKRARRFRR
jgi:hypothetical protein